MCLNKDFQAAMLVEANLSFLAGSSLVFNNQLKSPAFYWVSLNIQAHETLHPVSFCHVQRLFNHYLGCKLPETKDHLISFFGNCMITCT